LAAVHGGRAEALQNMRPHGAAWRGGVSGAPKAAYDGEDDGRKGTERRGGGHRLAAVKKRGGEALHTLRAHGGGPKGCTHSNKNGPTGGWGWGWGRANVEQLRLWRPQESDEGEAQGGPIGEWQWRWRRRGRTWLSAIVSGTYIHTAAAAAVRFEFLDKAKKRNQQTVGVNWAEGTSAVAIPQSRRGKDGGCSLRGLIPDDTVGGPGVSGSERRGG